MILANEDEFKAYAAEVDRKNNKPAGNGNYNSNVEYESQQWVGLEKGQVKIVRIVSNPPASMSSTIKDDPYRTRDIYFSEIMTDDGKHKMHLKLPLHTEDARDDHIMWKILSKAGKYEKVPNPKNPKESIKVYEYSGRDWFETMLHGGYKPTDGNYQFTKGWWGQEVAIMNVIDREDSWCADNKHTKLLSKNISRWTTKDGKPAEKPDVGVPAYGFLGKLSKLSGTSGSWWKYDVAIEKTGEKTNPYNVENATATVKSGMQEFIARLQGKDKYVSTADILTPEEMQYEMYDLEKLYAVTSYQKLLKNLGNTIKKMDADLGTTFYDQLVELANNEKAEWEAKKETEKKEEPAAPIQESTETVAEAPRTISRQGPAPEQTGLTPEKIALLKGWDVLTDREKSQVVDLIVNEDGTPDHIVYSEDAATLIDCNPDGCGHLSPKDFHACPFCSSIYG